MGSPSLIDGQGTQVLQRLNAALQALQNRVEDGGLLADGGTTQASGPNTSPNFDVDTTELLAQVKGVPQHLAAQTDADADAGDQIIFGATSGKTAVMAVVLETGALNDTPAVVGVAGAVADDGSEVAPTEAEIEAGVGHANWILLGDVTLARTGDTAITFTASYARRGGVQGRVADGGKFDRDLAVTEDDFKDYGA